MNVGRVWSVVATALALAALVGCDNRPTPVGVSGTVTFDGEPLPSGTVVFEPLSKTDGQRREATATDGKFDLPTKEGVLPGMEFKVVIKAFRKTGKKYPNADATSSYDEEVQYLPERYNSASDLRVKISPDEQENQLKFELISR